MVRVAGSTFMLAVLLGGAVPAHAADGDSAVFGAMPVASQISLSPSGSKIAYIQAVGAGGERLMVVDLDGDAKPRAILTDSSHESELARCDWATDVRLVCTLTYTGRNAGRLITFSRLLSIGDDGSQAVKLSAEVGNNALGVMQDGGSLVALGTGSTGGTVLMTRTYVPESQVGTRLNNAAEGLGVDAVDVVSGRRKAIEGASKEAIFYLADESGRVRLRVIEPFDSTGSRSGRRVNFYRAADSDAWRQWPALPKGEIFYPQVVVGARNLVYGYLERGKFTVAAAMPMTADAVPQVLAERSDVDVDELLTVGRSDRVIGASFATEKREVVYFDEAMRKLARQLAAALPGKPLVDIVDASADESRLLLIASSDTHPGTLYRYDRTAKRLEEVMPLRLNLAGRTMAEMNPVTFPAADGTQIPGYLTLPAGSSGKNLPAIVMPHGGPGSRDYWGFDWLVQFFAAKGFAVLQPNFRGSAGYGSDWFGKNGFQAWPTAIGDVADAGRWLVASGVADPGKLVIAGWSYGGYAALQTQVVDPDLFKAVVAIAPVTDLAKLVEDEKGFESYSATRDFIGSGDHVASGSPARHAGRFKAPVLLVHGTNDENVRYTQSRLMDERLKAAGKPVTYIELAGRDHYIEDSEARTAMLESIAAFLDKTVPD